MPMFPCLPAESVVVHPVAICPPTPAWRLRWPIVLAWVSTAGLCPNAWACDAPVGTLSSLEGGVEIRDTGSPHWRAASLDQKLCPGTTVMVHAPGRAAIVLNNKVLVRLDQNSSLTLQETRPDAEGRLDLHQGIAHVISRWRKRLSVNTPFVNALVDGTEFTVVSRADTARVVVAEGRVLFHHAQGPHAVDAAPTVLLAGEAAEAVADRTQAPSTLRVQPVDAVAWAIHYPQIVWLDAKTLTHLPPPAADVARHAQVLSARGQHAQALQTLQTWPSTLPMPASITAMLAATHLSVGHVDEAQALLSDSGRDASSLKASPEVLAVRALLAAVRNDSAGAQTLAKQAVAASPTTATAALAQSYAWQSARQLPKALNAARRATVIDPDNPLAWSRRAELELAAAEGAAAQTSAQQALARQPDAHHALTLQGMAQLLSGHTQQALQTLDQAVTTHSSHPLAHFGRGMARIRQGQIAEGRQDVELATLLDPSNAQLRAYLGRTYLEENRHAVAKDQFELAKRLDPASPTPWFFETVQRLRQADATGALHASAQASARNAHRTTVRPTDLTTADLASHALQTSDAYRLLGQDVLAHSAAVQAHLDDPLDPQTLIGLGRTLPPIHAESARHTVWTQALLSQPVGRWPIPPQVLTPSMPGLDGPRLMTQDETSQLFNRSGHRAAATALVGSRGLHGASALGAWNNEHWQLDLSGFDYRSDTTAFDQRIALDGMHLHTQFAPDPRVNLHLDTLHTNRGAGPIYTPLLSQGGNALFYKRYITDRTLLGAHLKLSAATTWTSLIAHAEHRQNLQAPQHPEFGTTHDQGRSRITATRWDQRHGENHYHWGAEHRAMHFNQSVAYPSGPTLETLDLGDTERTSHHLYGGLSGPVIDHPSLQGHLGLRHVDKTNRHTASTARESVPKVREYQPAVGLDWRAAPHWRVRTAWFKTVGTTESEMEQPSLQSATFNGFVRNPDDVMGSPGRLIGLGLDAGIDSDWPSFLEIARHRYAFNDFHCAGDHSTCLSGWETTHMRLGSHWLAHRHWSLGLEWHSKDTQRRTLPEKAGNTLSAIQLDTDAVKFISHWQPRPAWHVQAETQRVSQSGATYLKLTPVSTDFWITNLKTRHQWTQRVSLQAELKNAFNREFRYESTVFAQAPGIASYAPRRTFALSAQWQLE